MEENWAASASLSSPMAQLQFRYTLGRVAFVTQHKLALNVANKITKTIK